ncbi:hypothetical protein LINGRAHAP2_LOCUS30028 [Linum grandiflorum]
MDDYHAISVVQFHYGSTNPFVFPDRCHDSGILFPSI